MGVAMEFVLRIDELLYKVFFPIHYRKLVADINFFLAKPSVTEEDQWTKTMIAYAYSVAYVCLGIFITFFYMNQMQDVLPNDMTELRARCGRFLEHVRRPVCASWSSGSIQG